MTQKIEIKTVSDTSQAEKSQDKLSAKVEKLSQSYDKAGKASVKATEAAKGSVQRLEQELKDSVRELKRMEVGSRQFEEQKRRVAGLTRELGKARGQMRGLNNQGSRLSGLASSVASKVASVATGFFSIQTAITAISAEFDKIKRNQLKAAAQTRTFEESLADIAFNVGGNNLDAARKMVEDNAARLNTSQEGLANLIGLAISAGAKDIREAMSVSEASLKATAGDANKAAELVQSSLDIAGLAGSKNFRGALGQVSQTQSQVRATNASEFFSNLGPALAAATADRTNINAISTERTLELSSVISQILKDRTGANTATAVRQFITRLDSFAPELKKTLKDGTESNLTQQQIEQFRNTRSVDDRIDLFRNNEALRRQFLDQQKEGIGKSAIAEVIGGTARAIAIEQKAARSITDIDSAEGAFTELVDAVDRNTVLLQAERRLQAGIQAEQTQGSLPLQGQARKILSDTFDTIDLPGSDFIGRNMIEADFKVGADQGRNLADVGLETLSKLDEENRSVFAFWTRTLDEREKRDVERAKAQLEALKPLIDAAMATEELQRANNEILRAQNKNNGPQQVEVINDAPAEAPPVAAGAP